MEAKNPAGVAGASQSGEKKPPAFGSTATLGSAHSNTGSRMSRRGSKSRGSNLEKSLRLTAEQKCDIAQKEIDEFAQEVQQLNEEAEKVVDNLKVVISFQSIYSNMKHLNTTIC